MWSNRPGTVIVISGPSGSGKTSVVKALCDLNPTLVKSVSATTRPPRLGEVNGRDYDFLSHAQFSDLVGRDAFLEWATYGEHCYGTLKSKVTAPVNAGKDVILEIDVQGAMQLKRTPFRCVSIFVLPPSFAILEQRLRERKTESEEELRRRLIAAQTELDYAKHYDYCVINPENNVLEAARQIQHIILAEHCRVDAQLLAFITQEFSGKNSHEP